MRRELLSLPKKGPMSAGELAAHCHLTKPTMSMPFAKLKDADLATTERNRTSVIYHLNLSTAAVPYNDARVTRWAPISIHYLCHQSASALTNGGVQIT
jgi:DNA-binding transcriptional ArsR family regulator